MLKLSKLAIAALCASTALAAVDPELLALAAPDAKVLSGIDVERSKSAPFGKYVLTQMAAAASLHQFGDQTGFDATRDLKELLIASSDQGSLFLARGSFDPPKILAAADALASSQRSTYQGITLLVFAPAATASADATATNDAVAFLDTSLALAGDEALVKAALDRRASGAAAGLGALGDKAKEVSALNPAWFATLSSPGDFFAGKMGPANGAAQMNLFQNVLQAWGGIRFRAESILLSGDLVARTEKDAQAFADVLKFFLGLLQSNANSGGAAATLAQAAKITADGTMVHVSLEMPEKVVEQLFMDARPTKPPQK